MFAYENTGVRTYVTLTRDYVAAVRARLNISRAILADVDTYNEYTRYIALAVARFKKFSVIFLTHARYSRLKRLNVNSRNFPYGVYAFARDLLTRRVNY